MYTEASLKGKDSHLHIGLIACCRQTLSDMYLLSLRSGLSMDCANFQLDSRGQHTWNRPLCFYIVHLDDIGVVPRYTHPRLNMQSNCNLIIQLRSVADIQLCKTTKSMMYLDL